MWQVVVGSSGNGVPQGEVRRRVGGGNGAGLPAHTMPRPCVVGGGGVRALDWKNLSLSATSKT